MKMLIESLFHCVQFVNFRYKFNEHGLKWPPARILLYIQMSTELLILFINNEQSASFY